MINDMLTINHFDNNYQLGNCIQKKKFKHIVQVGCSESEWNKILACFRRNLLMPKTTVDAFNKMIYLDWTPSTAVS